METAKSLNYFLVDIFDDILSIQEKALKNSAFGDLSLNKLHIIEEVCKQVDNNSCATMTSVAESLEITVGTLTVAVENLVKKGYLKRIKSKTDKRVVNIEPTERGIAANDTHKKFHRNMVESVTNALSEGELEIFCKGVSVIADYFKDVKRGLI